MCKCKKLNYVKNHEVLFNELKYIYIFAPDLQIECNNILYTTEVRF
jgi:hypothetical protein